MPNPHTNRRLIWVLGLCAIGAIGVWQLVSVSTKASMQLAEPIEEPRPPSAATIARETSAEPTPATRRPAASTADAPPQDDRRGRLLRAFRKLSEFGPRMPPYSGRDFDEIDMSSLRKLVLEMGVEARELRDLLDSPYGDESTHSLGLAAFAFAKDVREEDREFLVGAVRTDLGEDTIGRDDPASRAREGYAYAGLFALRMHGAEGEVGAIAELLLERLPDPATHEHTLEYSSLRNLTAFALTGVDDGLSEKALTSLRRITANPSVGLLTSAAWRALARSARPVDSVALVQVAESKNGHAREGLEGTRDPTLTPTLTRLAAGSDRSVYGQYLAASAARGLLSIESEPSLAAFEDVCISEDAFARAAGLRALALDPPPTAAGTLLSVSARARAIQSDHVMLPAVHEAMNRICQRLRHATVPHQEVQQCVRGIRNALPRVVDDPDSLRSALEILAQEGDDTDRSVILIHLDGLQEADRAVVLEAWTSRRPGDPLR